MSSLGTGSYYLIVYIPLTTEKGHTCSFKIKMDNQK